MNRHPVCTVVPALMQETVLPFVGGRDLFLIGMMLLSDGIGRESPTASRSSTTPTTAWPKGARPTGWADSKSKRWT